ncbi:hypothetical protein [Stomatobaculum longum]
MEAELGSCKARHSSAQRETEKRESQQNKSDKLTAKAYHRIAEDTER